MYTQQQCTFKCISHCVLLRRERIYHVIYIIQNYEGSFFIFLIRIVPCLPALPLPLPALPFYVQRTHATAATPPRGHFLSRGHCTTEPLQQKGDGRFACNYKRWRWRRRRSTSLRLVLTTGPRPSIIISGDHRRFCYMLRDHGGGGGAEAKKLSLVKIYTLCTSKKHAHTHTQRTTRAAVVV